MENQDDGLMGEQIGWKAIGLMWGLIVLSIVLFGSIAWGVIESIKWISEIV